jgi:hypothetical protein
MEAWQQELAALQQALAARLAELAERQQAGLQAAAQQQHLRQQLAAQYQQVQVLLHQLAVQQQQQQQRQSGGGARGRQMPPPSLNSCYRHSSRCRRRPHQQHHQITQYTCFGLTDGSLQYAHVQLIRPLRSSTQPWMAAGWWAAALRGPLVYICCHKQHLTPAAAWGVRRRVSLHPPQLQMVGVNQQLAVVQHMQQVALQALQQHQLQQKQQGQQERQQGVPLAGGAPAACMVTAGLYM